MLYFCAYAVLEPEHGALQLHRGRDEEQDARVRATVFVPLAVLQVLGHFLHGLGLGVVGGRNSLLVAELVVNGVAVAVEIINANVRGVSNTAAFGSASLAYPIAFFLEFIGRIAVLFQFAASGPPVSEAFGTTLGTYFEFHGDNIAQAGNLSTHFHKSSSS